MQPNEPTSSSLIAKVRNSERDAWVRLVQLYSPIVYKWARRVGLQQDDAADIGQEVFRTVHARIEGYTRHESGGGFRAWLWQITRNKIGDYLRQSRVREQTIGDNNFAAPPFYIPFEYGEESKAEDSADLLNNVLRLIQNDFQDKTWRAFWLATIEEKPIDQIAETLGMQTKAVRQAKYRVLKRLREEFGDFLT